VNVIELGAIGELVGGVAIKLFPHLCRAVRGLPARSSTVSDRQRGQRFRCRHLGDYFRQGGPAQQISCSAARRKSGGAMSIWERVRAHLKHRPELREDDDGHPADIEIQVATAILLLEAAHGDAEYAWREHRAIIRGLQRGFGIGHAEAAQLVARAEEIRPPVVELADVTQVIVDRFSPEQRRSILGLLWQVIDADDLVEEWEEVFADHVADAVGLNREEAEAARRAPSP